MAKNPKVDEYIANAAEFAQPILKKLRVLIHQAHPDIEENIKWGMPSFDYKGIVCHLAAFKNHCSFGFMKHKLIKGLDGDGGMNSFGKITSLEDLPKDELLITYIKEAILLNEKGVKIPKTTKPKKELVVPKELQEALLKKPKAKAVFEDFAYSHRKEYIEWIADAKREETKAKRIAQTIEWLKENKRRNWKYENC
jgi:uncharacterized protein YdeI (YjbR/CyaY-like superfamily)